jgi:hypothetical protein
VKKISLQQELRYAGATPDEISPLSSLATQLGTFKHPPERKIKQRQVWFAYSAIAAVGCFVIGVGVTSFAQTSVPGGWLYPVKRLSENMTVAVEPDYRATIMMHRAEEVKTLVGDKESSQKVLAALSDYSTQAAGYHMSSYSTLEYCKSNLQEAAAAASPSERRAINKTLGLLRDA